jgi:hypothetical protein
MTQTDIVDPQISNRAPGAGSNSLPELAARIRAEHEATAVAMQRGVEHAMAAGDLLIEAKAQLKHGQWLPWLAEHCAMSERSAQLYMRIAKNRKAIEANTQQFADLNLNQVAALLMLSSDVRKLLEMIKTMEELQGDDLIEFCVANDVAMLSGNIFDAPEPTDQEWVEWNIFVLWLVRTQGLSVEGAFEHAEWVRSRGTLLADWMAPNPIRDAWMPISQALIDDWHTFLEQHNNWTLPDVAEKLKSLQSEFERARASQATKRRGSKRARR